MPARRLSPTALSLSLRAGAAYDAAFALLLVVFPSQMSAKFHLPLPGERFYLWLTGFFLFTLAAFYQLLARNPARNRDFLRLAIAVRWVGGTVLAAAAFGRPDLRGLYVIAFGDLAFGLAHFALSRSIQA